MNVTAREREIADLSFEAGVSVALLHLGMGERAPVSEESLEEFIAKARAKAVAAIPRMGELLDG